MPEPPELDHIRSRLEWDFTPRAIMQVALDKRYGPMVVRDLTGPRLPSHLTGRVFDDFIRRATTLSEIHVRRRVRNFCRRCQPGGLLRGMGPLN